MPHQCVKCNTLFEDGKADILKGCPNCSGRFFFFVRKEALDKVKKATASLTQDDKIKMESDVREIMGDDIIDESVVLDLESVNISEPGKFELDLVKLFKGEPLVYKLEDGKYIIDVATTFKNLREKDSKK